LEESDQSAISNLQSAILDGLGALTYQSLLQQRQGKDGEPRFILLETIHEYAWERLASSAEAPSIQQRHAFYYLALAEAAEGQLRSSEQLTWLDQLEAEHDNVRAELAWSLETDQRPTTNDQRPMINEKQRTTDNGQRTELGARLANALWWFWVVRGHVSEGRAWLDQMLANSSRTAETIRAKLLLRAGWMAQRQGDIARAGKLFQEGLALSEELGDRQNMAWALSFLGGAALRQADLERAAALCNQSLMLFQELDDRLGRAWVSNSLGELARSQGDNAQVAALYEESLALYHELGDRLGTAWLLHNMGYLAQHQGNYERAAGLFHESLALYQKWRNKLGIAVCLAGLAGVASKIRQFERAARLFGAAEAQHEFIGAHLDPADRADYERNVAAVRAQLEPAVFAVAWATGQAMSLEEAIVEALDLTTVLEQGELSGPRTPPAPRRR
jgi:tetratricopeptide (TPR) repeat protein